MARRITWALGLLALVATAACDSGTSETATETDAAAGSSDTSVAPADIGPVECWSAVDCDHANMGSPLAACKVWSCVAGQCVEATAGEDTSCAGDASALGACERWACNSGGQCVVRASFDGVACGAVDGCTGSYCSEGKCVETILKTCNDGNPCTADACAGGVCTFLPAAGACDDGNPCTIDDACVDGGCAGTPKDECNCTKDADCPNDSDPCNGVNKCTNNFCQPDPGTVIVCEPDAECTVSVCNPETGACEQGPSEDGLSCDDGDPCTAGDTCVGGACEAGAGVGCETECADDKDDDGDGDVDCADSDCAQAANCLPETDCGNKIDDDSDGKIDCDDEDCAADAACQVPTKETNCVDGEDNDQDGKADCDDDDCKTSPVCKPKVENCTNSIDDDKDGKVDCDDEDCAADVACKPATETACADGNDDDNDGSTDCQDTDCAADAACVNATCQAQGTVLKCGDVVNGDLGDAGATTTLVNSYGTCDSGSWAGPEAVWLFQPEAGGSMATFTLTDAAADARVFVIGGAQCEGVGCVAGGQATAEAGLLVDGYVVVDGPAGTTGTFTLTVTCTAP